MKILITGASGLVGRNLCDELNASHELLTPTHKELELSNYSDVVAYLKQHSPEMVIHCAGKVGGIQANLSAPVEFFVRNLDMGRNIVLASKECGIKQLINLGSSCMYPRNAENPLKEELILDGELEPTNEGYALAKITTQRLCQYLAQEDETYSYKTLVPCNLYGSYDKFDPHNSHMIPAVIRKIDDAVRNNHNSVEIWGDGTARREFMHVSDLTNCIRKVIADYNSCPAVMNVGLGVDYSINEYYQTIADIVGFEGDFKHDLSKPVGMKQKVVDVTCLNEFGWAPKLSLRDGLKKTYEFYIQNYRD